MWRASCILIALLALVACGETPEAPPPAAALRPVTMTGYDPVTKETIDPINLFDRLPGGKRIGTVPSGALVRLVQRNGDAALIITPLGVRGWVSVRFIQEFR